MGGCLFKTSFQTNSCPLAFSFQMDRVRFEKLDADTVEA